MVQFAIQSRKASKQASARGDKVRQSKSGLQEGISEARWRITAHASAQLPLRVLGLVAQQNFIPKHMSIVQVDTMLDIVLLVEGPALHTADVICKKLGAIIGVETAELTWSA